MCKYELKEKYLEIDSQLVAIAFRNDISKNELIRNPYLVDEKQAQFVFELLERRLLFLEEMKSFSKRQVRNIVKNKVVSLEQFKIISSQVCFF